MRKTRVRKRESAGKVPYLAGIWSVRMLLYCVHGPFGGTGWHVQKEVARWKGSGNVGDSPGMINRLQRASRIEKGAAAKKWHVSQHCVGSLPRPTFSGSEAAQLEWHDSTGRGSHSVAVRAWHGGFRYLLPMLKAEPTCGNRLRHAVDPSTRRRHVPSVCKPVSEMNSDQRDLTA